MKARVYPPVILAGSILLAFAHYGWAQTKSSVKIDVFKTVKPGQWVQVEGVPQKETTVMAKKIKILTGDFQNDDWEVFGTVRALQKQDKGFEILLLKIRSDNNTAFETASPTKSFKGLDDVKPGMLVEVEGTYLKDGTFLADEIQDETEGKADEAGTVTFVGKAEKVDPGKRTVTVMGVEFQITANTQAKSAIK